MKCFSLECGAKTVGWIQVIGPGFAIVVVLIMVILLVAAEPTLVEMSTIVEEQMNRTDVELIRKREEAEAAYSIALFVLIALVVFYGAVLALALFLLRALYKENWKHVKYWLVIKTGLLVLTIGLVVIEILLMLAGIDSEVNEEIIWVVIDTLQIWIVFNYYDEKKEYMAPAL